MSLKEKLMNIKKYLSESLAPIRKEDEFDALFIDHEVGSQNIYRLHYIKYYNFADGSKNKFHKAIVDWPFKPFSLPDGMTREDGLKVLSYLTDFIEQYPDIEEGSLKSLTTLNTVLDLERLGFKRFTEPPKNYEIIDLFTIDGRVRRFLDSPYYDKYFDWYTPNVSKAEVENIYKKCGREFHDLVCVEDPSPKQRCDAPLSKAKKYN